MSHLSPFVQACVIAAALVMLGLATAVAGDEAIKRFGARGRYWFLAIGSGVWAYALIAVVLYWVVA